MEWWAWVLIAIGVAVLGYVKLYYFKKMREKKAGKKTCRDEE